VIEKSGRPAVSDEVVAEAGVRHAPVDCQGTRIIDP